MQITETASEPLKKSYRVTIDGADIARATEAELQTLSKRVKMPGFRPGFVPIKIMQQRYGASVRDDVIKNVVTDATEKAITGNKLRIAAQPDIKVEEYKEGGDLVFSLSVDLMPEVPKIDFTKITIDREMFEIEEKAIEDALQAMLKANPKPAALPATAKAEEGNMVTMDFVGKVDGKPFDGGTAEGFRIVIGAGRLIPGFEEQLIGVKAGDEKEVKVKFPDEYFSQALAGKDAVFAVKVQEVAKLETPEGTDDFAKEHGFESLKALREAMKARLKHDFDNLVRSRLKKRLFDALEEQYDFSLPPSMVQMEFDAIWSQLQQARSPGISDADLYEGKSEEEMRKEYQHIAARRVKLGIALAEIGKVQTLQVTREELSRAVAQQAAQFPGQENAVFDFYRKNPSRLEEFRGPILEEKSVDWLLSQVKTNPIEMSTKELAELAEGGEEDAAAPQKREKKATPKKKLTSGKKKKKEE